MIAAAVLLLLTPCCRAQGDELWDSVGAGALERAAERYDVGVELAEGLEPESGAAQLLRRAADHLPEAVRAGVRSALLLLVVVLLCGMAEGAMGAGESGSFPVTVTAGALAITALAVSDVSTMMGLGRSTIDDMQGFGTVLLPVMAACTAATGAAAGAAARQVATAACSSLLLTVIDRLLVPLVYAQTAACAAYAAVGNPGLKRVAELLRWVVTAALRGLLAVFVAYLTVSGAAAGTADAAALKAAKTAISGLVPVVGGIISGTAETILAGAGVLKNTVGLFGMLAVLGICAVPFVRLGVHYLAYKLCGALAATLADSRLAELINGIASAFGLILGMTGTCTLLLLVSMLSGVMGVGG